MTLFTGSQIADLRTRSWALLERLQGLAERDNDDMRAAITGINAIIKRYGRAGAAFAVRAWCDAVIDATPGAQRGRPVNVVFISPDQTQLVDRQHILPERQWASDVLAARFADDHVALYQLLEQLPDTTGMLIYLFRLVEMAAGLLDSYRQPPAGPIRVGLHNSIPTPR